MSRLVEHGGESDRVVFDAKTGLVWRPARFEEGCHGLSVGDDGYSSFDSAKNKAIFAAKANREASRLLEALNADGYGGYSDWRLPAEDEVLDLIDDYSLERCFGFAAIIWLAEGDNLLVEPDPDANVHYCADFLFVRGAGDGGGDK